MHFVVIFTVSAPVIAKSTVLAAEYLLELECIGMWRCLLMIKVQINVMLQRSFVGVEQHTDLRPVREHHTGLPLLYGSTDYPYF